MDLEKSGTTFRTDPTRADPLILPKFPKIIPRLRSTENAMGESNGALHLIESLSMARADVDKSLTHGNPKRVRRPLDGGLTCLSPLKCPRCDPVTADCALVPPPSTQVLLPLTRCCRPLQVPSRMVPPLLPRSTVPSKSLAHPATPLNVMLMTAPATSLKKLQLRETITKYFLKLPRQLTSYLTRLALRQPAGLLNSRILGPLSKSPVKTTPECRLLEYLSIR